MKSLYKIALLAMSMLLIAGCGKTTTGKLDANTVLSIRPDKSVKLRSETTSTMTALEVVKKTERMSMKRVSKGGIYTNMGFADVQKDLNPEDPRLKMWATFLIDQLGDLHLNLLEDEDIVLEGSHTIKEGNNSIFIVDTLGYIPTAPRREAIPYIKQAYAEGRYEDCYKKFDEVMRFKVCTASEWRELKKRGEQ